MRKPWQHRFWEKVAVGSLDRCWPWTSGTRSSGYGSFHLHDRDVLAHRVSFELSVAPIPDGLLVLHSCDTPRCCNPRHLFLGTQGDNVRDMVAKGRRADTEGFSNPNAKLGPDEVLEILSSHTGRKMTTGDRRLCDGPSGPELALRFGVSSSTIYNVLRAR